MSKRTRAVVGLGAVVAIAAGVTAAAFTDFANLNLGANGIGADQYNIQVVDTDPTTGAQIPGSWQEANTPAGAPIELVGANTIFPGSTPISVDIPVRNASATLNSTLSLGLVQLPDAGANVTDPDYLSSLRFTVTMPATSLGATPISVTDQTFAELSTLALNGLAAGEESSVTIQVRLLTQAESGSTFTDNDLNGMKAFIQAQFNGTSAP
ncbi:hypothetical protein [Leifsonia shinshuensis]|uniref:Alternate-type signal peptide domain-containing protein n=1 Tax=Leifsonia shinshuensis TaxID=150026 RepID=A0A7G6Y798_9MICO|nr:hypothetical protein [Leifsonia shinshuensis]QNE34363.1 hypothetical protein F1C12_03910 [Leifsonia shinshuensis]